MRTDLIWPFVIFPVLLLVKVSLCVGQDVNVVPGALIQNEAAGDDEFAGQEIIPQVRQMLLSELIFIQQVCQLNKEQRIPIAKGGQASVKTVIKKYGEVQRAMQRGMFQFNANNGSPYPNSRRILRESLLEVVKQHATKEQFERYETESKKRDETFKRVAVLAFVAKLDNELILNEAQREKLVAALLANYNDKWCESLEVLTYGDHAYPSLPPEIVGPVLDEQQKKVWQDSQVQNSVFWGFLAINNVIIQPDVDWSDLIAPENREAINEAKPKDAPSDVEQPKADAEKSSDPGTEAQR